MLLYIYILHSSQSGAPIKGMSSGDSTTRCPFRGLAPSLEARVCAGMRPGSTFLAQVVSRAPNSTAVLLVCRKERKDRASCENVSYSGTLRGNAIQVGAPQLVHKTGRLQTQPLCFYKPQNFISGYLSSAPPGDESCSSLDTAGCQALSLRRIASTSTCCSPFVTLQPTGTLTSPMTSRSTW